MTEINDLLNRLQSIDPARRYDACEELRVSPFLPPEALEALHSVTSDGNPDVADAARRAIKLHVPETNFEGKDEKKLIPGQTNNTPPVYGFLHILISAIYVPVISFGSRVFPPSLLVIAILWIITSVIISRLLINKNNLIAAYLILFSPLFMICLLLSTMIQIDG